MFLTGGTNTTDYMFDYSFDYNIYRIQKNDYNNKYSKGINSYYYDFETTLTQIKKYFTWTEQGKRLREAE